MTLSKKIDASRLIWVCLFSLFLAACGEEASSPASAPEVESGETQDTSGPRQTALDISGAYLRQPAPGQTMLAAFVTFKNNSNQAYTLNHVNSPRASAVEVHRTMYNNGVMSMRHVHHLVVPPQSELAFKPGGYHLMLTGVEGELKPGDQVPLQFSFEGGITVSANAEVRPIH